MFYLLAGPVTFSNRLGVPRNGNPAVNMATFDGVFGPKALPKNARWHNTQWLEEKMLTFKHGNVEDGHPRRKVKLANGERFVTFYRLIAPVSLDWCAPNRTDVSTINFANTHDTIYEQNMRLNHLNQNICKCQYEMTLVVTNADFKPVTCHRWNKWQKNDADSFGKSNGTTNGQIERLPRPRKLYGN